MLVACVVLSTVGQAAPIGFGGVLPGGAMVGKQVVSLRELKFREIVEQQTDYSCGAAAVATILQSVYHRPTTEQEVLTGLSRVSDPAVAKQFGFSLLDLKRYVTAIGMEGRGFKLPVDALPKLQIPVIVLLDIHGYKHFVVVRTATADTVYIADPALGNREVSREEFAKGWNGIIFAVLGDGVDKESPLAQAVETPSVKRTGLHAPLQDAELFEFGFLHGQFF